MPFFGPSDGTVETVVLVILSLVSLVFSLSAYGAATWRAPKSTLDGALCVAALLAHPGFAAAAYRVHGLTTRTVQPDAFWCLACAAIGVSLGAIAGVARCSVRCGVVVVLGALAIVCTLSALGPSLELACLAAVLWPGVVFLATLNTPGWPRPSRLPPTQCVHCGYDLRGLPSQTCPECGKNARVQ